MGYSIAGCNWRSAWLVPHRFAGLLAKALRDLHLRLDVFQAAGFVQLGAGVYAGCGVGVDGLAAAVGCGLAFVGLGGFLPMVSVAPLMPLRVVELSDSLAAPKLVAPLWAPALPWSLSFMPPTSLAPVPLLAGSLSLPPAL